MSRFPPYGFFVGSGSSLVPHAEEQRVLAKIVALRAGGRSLRAIARELAARGIMARAGRPFGPQTLAQVLRRTAPVTAVAGTRCSPEIHQAWGKLA